MKDINFTVEKGQKIALVGASGSGKTTSVNLLCGFYNPDKGDILIDGVSIKSVDLKKWSGDRIQDQPL